MLNIDKNTEVGLASIAILLVLNYVKVFIVFNSLNVYIKVLLEVIYFY